MLHLVRCGQLLCYADKRIVNMMKVYIEGNIMQVELLRFRKKKIDFILTFTFAKRGIQCNIAHRTHLQTAVAVRQSQLSFDWIQWVDAPRLWPFNMCVVVGHPITLFVYAD